MGLRFGRQRAGRDIAAVGLLLVGFTAIAYAMWLSRGAWFGALLPVAFVIGIAAGFRSEVREVELTADSLVIRTFFRGYPIPREHIKAVVLTPRGVAIDVLNGARYYISPPEVDDDEMFAAVRQWHAVGATAEDTRSS